MGEADGIGDGVEVTGGTGVVVPENGVGVAFGARAREAGGDADGCSLTAGFTNFFGGASGGGVASDRILARAFSASGLLAVVLSTFACWIGAPTFRGRSTARAVKSGVIIAIVSPRTTACGAWFPSTLY